MFRPTVSVVVNTYNRAASLRQTLFGLSQINYDNFEIVVVNGPSTDETNAVLEGWADRIKLTSCDVANLSVSRNVGIASASGDIVAFIDDDAVPHPQWIARLVCAYADESVGGVGGFTVDNTGIQFQCRKTLCDRYGNAYFVDALFDERPLNQPGLPIFPTLLGTNSSFRRSVLFEIGGFDHAFAYLLDETDVCLRIVDAGYRIVYEASALVFHQFASSHIRTARQVPRTLYPSAVSKAYFIMRHGTGHSPEEAGKQLVAYREECLTSNQWLADHGLISMEHRVSLDQDLMGGIKNGMEKAYDARLSSKGDLTPLPAPPSFSKYPVHSQMRVALISQGFPPSGQAGIARWTWMIATGLARRGHAVHVVCRADATPFTKFDNGYWIHAVEDDVAFGEILASEYKIPLDVASRAAAVRRAIAYIKSFGLDVLSFPIWDVEGIGCMHDPDVAVMMSLHTSYGLAKPHKKEWTTRPLYEHFSVNPVIRAEHRLLENAPNILANSKAIVADLSTISDVEFGDRLLLCPHGTIDPFLDKPQRRSARSMHNGTVRLLYVGRFEVRKGFDIAMQVFANVLRIGLDVKVEIAGDDLTADAESWLESMGVASLLHDERIQFRGVLSRDLLDDLFSEVDIVVMPSRYESFGLVAIEAMAAGAPVVTLNAGGLAEVVADGVSGRVLPADGYEVQSITDAVIAMVQNSTLRHALGRGAREAYEREFTVDKMVDGVEKALRLAVQRKGGACGA